MNLRGQARAVKPPAPPLTDGPLPLRISAASGDNGRHFEAKALDFAPYRRGNSEQSPPAELPNPCPTRMPAMMRTSRRVTALAVLCGCFFAGAPSASARPPHKQALADYFGPYLAAKLND